MSNLMSRRDQRILALKKFLKTGKYGVFLSKYDITDGINEFVPKLHKICYRRVFCFLKRCLNVFLIEACYNDKGTIIGFVLYPFFVDFEKRKEESKPLKIVKYTKVLNPKRRMIYDN